MTAQYHDDQFSRPRTDIPERPDRAYHALPTLAEMGGIAADLGGALMAAELLLGSATPTAATVELAGCALAALISAVQAALGDAGAIERTGRDLLNRGALRLMPDTLRRMMADRLFR